MLGRLTPREGRFFDLFNAHAERIVEGALMPIGAAVYALVWVGLLLTIRIASVASLIAVATAPLSAALLDKYEYFPLLLGFALLVVWKHRPNIQRLFAGTEPKIGRGTA